MINIEPIVYEYNNPYIKQRYKKQEEHNNKYSRFFFKNTFEIYNHVYDIWETYFPYFLNYNHHNLNDKYVKKQVYYIIKYSKVPSSNIYPKLEGLNYFIEENISKNDKEEYKKSYKIFDDDYEEKIKNIILNYIDNGNYYETTINEYVKDNKIRIRPIKNTTAYSFCCNLSMIKNNYWIQKEGIEIIQE